MKKNRIFSFIIIGLIYIIATIIGLLAYKKLSYAFWINLLIADVVATIIVFIFSCILKNASVYDPYWSVQPIVIILFFIYKYGFNITNILFLIVVSIWGLRLTLNWIYTFKNLYVTQIYLYYNTNSRYLPNINKNNPYFEKIILVILI